MRTHLYVAAISISDNLKETGSNVLEHLKSCDIAIGEEKSIANKLLRISESNAKLFLLNEHSTIEDKKALVEEVKKVEKAVLFTDAGTPCISDPDYLFIKLCRQEKIIIRSIPGASSITSAISVSGINASTFFFAGFPPKDEIARRKFYARIASNSHTIVFMERPYALTKTLEEITFIRRKISLSINLGSDSERTYYDYPDNILNQIGDIKAPFVIVMPGRDMSGKGTSELQKRHKEVSFNRSPRREKKP